jgi:UDP-N-acetylmuramate--alanine ligase
MANATVGRKGMAMALNLDIKDFKQKKVFFSGIGGVSMSSLSMILKNNGYQVFGSDRSSSETAEKLIKNGIKVIIGQKKENISDVGIVVRTAAVADDNPEILEAKAQGIPIMERSTLLGQVMREYVERINIAGTHGKTTTTAMMGIVLIYAGLAPTITVGGDFSKIGGNLLIGENDFFVCEACEYVESFLEFYPSSSIVLNIEADHLDYYRDIEHIKSAFKKFILKTEKLVVANGDDKHVLEVTSEISDKNIVLFGIENGKYRAKNIEYLKAITNYDLYCENVFLGKITLKVAGNHNVLNSLAVSALALELGIDISYIKSALFDFTGTKRRMEYIGEYKGIPIYDDYAHHPTEIKTTILSLRQKTTGRIVAVFQPHTYSRTKSLKDEFIEVLNKFDKLFILDIYSAREKDLGEIHSKDLLAKLKNATYIENSENAANMIDKELKKGDIFVTIGAGDVNIIGERLLKNEALQHN